MPEKQNVMVYDGYGLDVCMDFNRGMRIGILWMRVRIGNQWM